MYGIKRMGANGKWYFRLGGRSKIGRAASVIDWYGPYDTEQAAGEDAERISGGPVNWLHA